MGGDPWLALTPPLEGERMTKLCKKRRISFSFRCLHTIPTISHFVLLPLKRQHLSQVNRRIVIPICYSVLFHGEEPFRTSPVSTAVVRPSREALR